MTVTIAYSTDATAWGGRRGRVTSSDTRIDLELSMPKELGGDGGPGTNPEQMFAAGYAACFHSALKGMARIAKVDADESAVTVTVGLGQDEATSASTLAVTIAAEMPGIAHDTVVELMEQAHARCPYSNATRGNVEVTLVVEAS
jgi:Ohr subfamily peroxiredoxin